MTMINRMPWFVLLILAALVNYPLSAQVRVEVRDEQGQPMAYVNTVLLSHDDPEYTAGASGNEQGVVFYNNLDPGMYKLVMIYLGYESDTVEHIAVNGGSYLDLGVRRMRPESFLLEVVEVVAKAPVITRKGNQLTYNIEKTTLAGGETALSLLNNVPGVIVSSRNDITVNGKGNVTVLLDGRRQHLSGEELSALLRSLASESIRQVEVVSVGSARYDAGGGPIINIVSRRSAASGINGSAWTRYRQGRQASSFTGFNLNWKVRDLSGNIYYYLSHYRGFHDIDVFRSVDGLGGSGASLFFRERIDEHWKQVSHTPRIRLFYDIDDGHRIGIYADLIRMRTDFPNENTIEISHDGGMPDSTVRSVIGTKETRLFPSFNLNYQGRLPDGEGSVEAAYDYFIYDYDKASQFSSQYFNDKQEPLGPPLEFREFNPLTSEVHTALIDVSKPLAAGHRFDAGGKVTFIEKASDTRFEERDNGEYVPDEDRSRSFDHREHIYAAYMNWSGPVLQGWQTEAGLRMEYTRISRRAVPASLQDHDRYADLFPFLSFSREAANGNTLRLSYARKMMRPTFQQLSPFVLVVNPYLVSSGDPGLLPQRNNLFDVEYAFGGHYTVYAGYNLAQNSINSIFLDQGSGVYNLTWMNFNVSHFANLGFSMTKKLNDWWELTANANMAYDNYRARIGEERVHRDGLSASFNIRQQFLLPGGFFVDLLGLYESPRYTSVEYYQGTGRIDVSLTKHFIAKDLSIKLRGRDLFYTSKTATTLDYGNLRSDYAEWGDSRRFELSVTYKFKYGEQFKARRNRNSNLEEKDRT